MPPHHWLRFGRTPETAIGFFQDVAEGSDIPIIVHQYPAWTKAGYSLAEMLEMVKKETNLDSFPTNMMIKLTENIVRRDGKQHNPIFIDD